MPIRMPKLSMTMEEGEFGSWLVSVGDTISKGAAVAVV
jgi:pyruvate/2-oxoglutarate dehydrogenase complex dihydrolipoamide acyltransferase (E2) component